MAIQISTIKKNGIGLFFLKKPQMPFEMRLLFAKWDGAPFQMAIRISTLKLKRFLNLLFNIAKWDDAATLSISNGIDR